MVEGRHIKVSHVEQLLQTKKRRFAPVDLEEQGMVHRDALIETVELMRESFTYEDVKFVTDIFAKDKQFMHNEIESVEKFLTIRFADETDRQVYMLSR